jgi:hypothetical protein
MNIPKALTLLIAFFSFFKFNVYAQVSVTTLQKAVVANSNTIPTIFKGYKNEHTDKSGTIFYGNNQNSNTIAIEQKQGSNIVFFGFDNKDIFYQLYNEIDKISLNYGCNITENFDDALTTPIEVKCECNGYFYYLKTLHYNNIVAGYQIKVAKANNKNFIVKDEEIIVANNSSETERNDDATLSKDSIVESKLLFITKQAEYKGGETALKKYLSQNIKKPNDATDWHGKVIVNFTIDSIGTITDVEIISDRRNEYYLPISLKYEIIKVFNTMPKWSPAQTSDGTTARTLKQIPLQF